MAAFGFLFPHLWRLRRVFNLSRRFAAQRRHFRTQPAADAGFRAAGFVLLATGMRPLGGWLSDRIGGARVLSIVFFGVAPFALLLAWPSMPPFTVGALGCAALLGAR